MAESANVCDNSGENALTLEGSPLDGKTSFVEQLSKHFQNSDFCDVTLVVGEKRFSAHKTILAAFSSYFKRMFYGGSWKESSGQTVKLEETPSCAEVFELFLKYFYSGSVSVNIETVIPMVTLADKYDVQGLKDICTTYMVDTLGKKSDVNAALGWIAFADQMGMSALVHKCYELISYNFDKACTLPGWVSLSIDQMLAILKRSDVVVSNEYNVFQSAQTWLLGHLSTKTEIEQVLAQVQLKNMTAKQLCEVEKSELASLDLCKKHYLLKLPLYDAFRYVAVKQSHPEGEIIPAEIQRCYTDSPLCKVTFSGSGDMRCAKLTPKYTTTSEPSKYQWELVKHSSSNQYLMKLPKISRTHQHGYSYQTFYLSTYLPGDISLNLVFVIRDKDGHTIEVINGAFQTKIPTENGKTIIEFPEREHGSDHVPHDVMYSFSIEKV